MNQSRQVMRDLCELQGVVKARTGPGNGHTHLVTIPSIVDGGAKEGGMKIITHPSPVNGATHVVELTPEDLVSFHKGQTVTVTTSPDNRGDPHTHSLTFDRTMEPDINPRQDADEGSINNLGTLSFPRAGRKPKKKRKPTPGGSY